MSDQVAIRTISPDELRRRSRIDGREPASDIAAWAVSKGFARVTADGLVPTRLGAVVGAAVCEIARDNARNPG